MRRRPALTPTRSAEAAALGLIVLVVGIAAGRGLAAHSAEFDEGVYLGSARALADGAALGTDVFASQPPLFFIGLRALASGGAGDPAAMRGAILLLALGGVLAAALVVRPIAGPAGGCLAALFVGLSPAVVDRAAVVSADVPALALGLMALAAATAVPHRSPRATAMAAAAAGALLAAAVLVKLLAVPFLVAIVAGALRRRAGLREWLAGGMGAAAVAALTLLPLASRWGDLWHGAVGIRGAARGVDIAASGLDVPFALGFAGLGVAALSGIALAPAAGLRRWVDERAGLIALLVASALLLALQRPLFLHHWALLSVPAALVAASAFPRRIGWRHAAALTVALALLSPGAIRGRVVLASDARAELVRIAGAVETATPVGSAVVSDLPLVPLLAGRPAPASTIDASLVRVGSGALGRAAVLRAAERAETVVVGRAFATVPGLVPALSSRFPRSRTVAGVRVMWRGSPDAAIR